MTKKLSIVVCHYDIPREIPRTLFSLSPIFQLDVDPSDYEIVVVDNGSKVIPDLSYASEWGVQVRLLVFPNPNPSPVAALNYAVSQTEGDYLCVYIDGARIASPRLIASALEALMLSPRTVVGCRGRYLGPAFQSQSMRDGYNKEIEDEKLSSIRWEKNGYKLFEISVPDESAGESLLDSPSESNALFMSRRLWNELGGYDTTFNSPAGGYCNLDIWSRATSLNGVKTVLLIGESTFHQLHGGTATNALNENVQVDMHNEYEKIRGKRYTRPIIHPYYYGSLYGKLVSEAEEISKPIRAYWERDQALEQLRKQESKQPQPRVQSYLVRIYQRMSSKLRKVVKN